MAVSDNYIPQSENLEHLEKVISDLKEVSVRGTILKSKAVSAVDRLTQKLNSGSADNQVVIERLNAFLSQYPDDNAGLDNESPKSIREQMDMQNKRLKKVLAETKAYNREAAKVSAEYEEAISKVLNATRALKDEEDKICLSTLKELTDEINKSREKEWKGFEQLISNEHIIHKLVRTITDLYGILDQNSINVKTTEQIKFLLQFYQARLNNDPDTYKLRRQEVLDILLAGGLE